MAGEYDYMLSGIYVQGSLKNVDGGFQFQVKNNVESASITGFTRLEVDGEAVPLANLMVGKGEEATQPAAEITWGKSIYVPWGQVLTIKVMGKTLSPGEHTLKFSFNVAEAGPMTATLKAKL